jgi:hypothetical protein
MWRRRSIDVSLLLLLITVSCARVTPPIVVLVVPGPNRHDISAWSDADTVCVQVPPVQAVYLMRRCLSMATVRGLILSIQQADEESR